MTILFDGRPLADAKSGGVKRVTQGLLDALRRTSSQTKIIVASTGAQKNPRADQRCSWPNKILSILFFLHLTSFDRIFNKTPSDLLFLPNLGWLGRKPKLPYAILIHDLSFLIEPRWFTWKSRLWHRVIGAKKQIRNARFIFAVSETTKRDITRLLDIPSDRITVIPMGIDPTFHAEPNPSSIQKKYLLALGSSDPRKNTSLAKQVAQETKIELKLVGEKPYDNISDEELATLYRDALVFLYPSWYEGFGLPLHEAARFGTPCIASTAGALPETAPQGTLFASPAKTQHWIQAVSNVIADPSRYRTTSKIQNFDSAAEQIIRRLSLPVNPPHQNAARHPEPQAS